MECGSTALFCPLSSSKMTIASEGHFTTPIDSPSTTRSSESPCPAGYACLGGVKTECITLTSFQPVGGQALCSSCSTCAVGEFISASCTTTSDTGCSDCPAGTSGDGTSPPYHRILTDRSPLTR